MEGEWLMGGDSAIMFGEGNERKQLERAMRDAGRLPPGQSATLKWPVLHEGSVPRFDPQTWDFRVKGLVEKPLRLTLGRILAPADERRDRGHALRYALEPV